MNQARRRNRKREFRIPRATVRLGKPRSDCQDDIRFQRCLIGDACAPNSGHAERERIAFGKDAFAHECRRDRRMQKTRDFRELLRRLAQCDAVTGIDNGPYGLHEEFRRSGNAFVRAHAALVCRPPRDSNRRRIDARRKDVHRNVD